MEENDIPGYRLIKQLSTYGPGEAWKAHSARADQFVIIHFLLLDSPLNENDQRKFLREASICAQLNHPGLVRFLTQGITNNRLWFVTELVQGNDLSQFVQKRQPIHVDVSINIILQVLDTIAYLHGQGIIHRGLRPESLVIEEKGGDPIVHLVDLGSAKCFRTAELEGTVTKVGERSFPIHPYTAPEALENPQELDPRSDIYALGALLYFLLAGRPPYDGTDETLLMMQIIERRLRPLKELKSGLPKPLIDFVEHSMEQNIAARYDSVEKMSQALRQVTDKSESAIETHPSLGTVIYVRGDLVHGDKTTVDNKGSVGVIGPTAKANVTQSIGVSAVEIANAFAIIQQAINTLTEGARKEKAEEAVKELEIEACRGEDAEDGRVQKWFALLAEASADAWEIAVATLANPMLGLGTAFKKIAARAKEEKTKGDS